MSADTTRTELLGSTWVVQQLIRDHVEVAYPARDIGVDLVAYFVEHRDQRFVSVPLQLKVASGASFGVWQKFDVPSLAMIHVWFEGDYERIPRAFGLSYSEAVRVAEKVGWADTASWRTGRQEYVQTIASPTVRELLARSNWKEGPGGIWSCGRTPARPPPGVGIRRQRARTPLLPSEGHAFKRVPDQRTARDSAAPPGPPVPRDAVTPPEWLSR